MQVLKNLFGLNKKIAASEIAIKDSNGKGVTLDEFLNNYSTKVISTTETLNANSILSIETGISDADSIWIDSGNSYIYNNNNTVDGGRNCYPIPFNVAPGETSTYIAARMNGTNIELLSNGGWNQLWTKVITVKYTKTTD